MRVYKVVSLECNRRLSASEIVYPLEYSYTHFTVPELGQIFAFKHIAPALSFGLQMVGTLSGKKTPVSFEVWSCVTSGVPVTVKRIALYSMDYPAYWADNFEWQLRQFQAPNDSVTVPDLQLCTKVCLMSPTQHGVEITELRLPELEVRND